MDKQDSQSSRMEVVVVIVVLMVDGGCAAYFPRYCRIHCPSCSMSISPCMP